MKRGRGYAAKRRVTFQPTPPGVEPPRLTNLQDHPLPQEWVDAGYIPVITEDFDE